MADTVSTNATDAWDASNRIAAVAESDVIMEAKGEGATFYAIMDSTSLPSIKVDEGFDVPKIASSIRLKAGEYILFATLSGTSTVTTYTADA